MSSLRERAKTQLRGVIVPIVTPLKPDESLDLEILRSLVDQLIEQGVHGLFANGTTGEYPKLAFEERKKVIEIVVDQTNGRIPVMAGTGGVSTKEAIEMTQYAQDAGADYAVVVEPFYFHPTPDAIFDHYEVISEESDIPLIVYEIPSMTGYSLSPELLARIATIDSIVAMKDSSGDMWKFQQKLHLTGNDICVIQGAEPLFLPSLVIGSPAGVLGGANIFANLEVKLYESFTKGDFKTALQIHNMLIPILRSLSCETYPAAIKEAMEITGIKVGPVRKPALPLTQNQRKEIEQELTKIGIIKK